MKKAIITGSTGLIGRALAKHLYDIEVDVLCLGHRFLTPVDILNIVGRKVCYLNIEMEEILTLPAVIKSSGWVAGGDCIFYHFAWGGHERLTDGSFGEQLSNAIHAANAVKAAKQLECRKFVNAGTIEETYVEKYVKKNDNEPYQSTQIDYSLAKIAGRDMCKIIAYLEKIDYIHTRLSAPLDPELSMGSYIASTLRKIMKGEPYEAPVNKKLFDIISVNEVANAYRLIGEAGKNKSDYFIGTGNPVTLSQFFKDFAELISGTTKIIPEVAAVDSHLFSIEQLVSDTGFVPVGFFQDFQKTHNIK
jgi:nucleoside-diphosphate-sugar epimerase